MYQDGVSLILNTLNDDVNIEVMLKSLKDSTYDQLIVVDGGSSDKTISIAKQYSDEVYIVDKGILRQQAEALTHVKHKHLVILEADNIYPSAFIENLLSEYKSSNYFALHATVVPIYDHSFFEKGMKLFFEIHNYSQGGGESLGGVGIWDAEKYIEIFKQTQKVQGYSSDTARLEVIKSRELKVGLGKTIVWQAKKIGYKDFIKQYFNYGKGDYEFYESHKKQWTTRRKLKSIFHVFNRYVIDYPVKSFRVGKPHIAIPYLWASAVIRYYGWVYSLVSNIGK